ncbi:unnamed protein product [Vitrella brassicaformis CCMP3155]|uniref:Uncharacterized protein n=2 Tax=Vitrella brassicaformis TaxID=1169539 RepID=A0A0G4GF90_VITBC|nr:unnamed protein product [Vitrella brassicaformis CCMP3155]|eukprot:CEM28191.1 unnamed protein product [Vitrella brassicaformis CCMP3155]
MLSAMFGVRRAAHCEGKNGNGNHGSDEAQKTATILHPAAFPELMKGVPMTPKQDEEYGYHKYKWGYEPVPTARTMGGRTIREKFDNNQGKAKAVPWPHDMRPHAENVKPESDRFNLQYYDVLSDFVPLGGFSDKPKFSSQWEKDLAYNTNLYAPEMYQETKGEDDIRTSITNYADKIHADGPNDACKYLLMEEFRCREAHQAHMQPDVAVTRCMKWKEEWKQCMWDQEKLTRGYMYIQRRQDPFRRKYFFGVEHQYS